MDEKNVPESKGATGNEFLSSVAHQIGTSLAIVRWTLEEMSASPSIASDPQNRENVTNLLATSERMARIVGNLLRAARIEQASEFFPHNPEAISLTVMLQNIVATLAPLAKKSNISLQISVPDEQIFINADKDTMTGSIENIIDNAIKYSPEGKNAEIFVTLKKDDGHAVVSIRDEGIGIPTEDQNRIFEKFFRGRNARESKIHGTGLGLFIVKKMIEGNGGKLSFESAEGKGTTFFITVPLIVK